MNAKEFILENDEEAREAVFNGYDLRMSEPELLEWMEKYAAYKAENLPISDVSISSSAMGNYLDGYAKETCGHCGLKRTKQGHDGCIGELEGVMNACCGHGQNSVAYVQLDHPNYTNEPNKYLLQGNEALAYINEHKSVGE